MQVVNGNAYNIIYQQLANGVIQISGTVDASGTAFYLLNENIKIYPGTGVVTQGMTVEEYNNIDRVGLAAHTALDFYFQKRDLRHKETHVIYQVTNDVGGVPEFIFVVKTNGNFSFTIHNLYVYRGAFVNPPHIPSLDVEVSNQFVRYNEGTHFRINHARADRSWLRIVKIAGRGVVGGNLAAMNKTSYTAFWSGEVIRLYSNGYHTVHLRIYAVLTISAYSTPKKAIYYINAERTRDPNHSASDTSFMKYVRFAYAFDDLMQPNAFPSIYLEVKCINPSSASNPFVIVPDSVYHDLGVAYVDNELNYIISPQVGGYSIYGDDDTVIGSEVAATDVGTVISPFSF